MLNFFLIGLMFAAVIYVLYTYILKRELDKCPKVKYEYRPYIRTFSEEQENPVSPLGLYKDLFNKPSPWWSSTGNASRLAESTIQPFSWQGLPKSEVLREGESGNFVNSYFG
jgi:hypothetical protein